DVQRRAAVGVLDVGLFALGDQLLDLGGVAARGGIVKPGIDAQLPLARRGLRKAYGAGELGYANRHESNQAKASRHGCIHRGVSAGQIELCARRYHARSQVLSWSHHRLEFKSGDFKPGLIAPSGLSTTRLAGQRAKAISPGAVAAGASARRFPASRPAQSGMRSTGLIVVPCEESCAARLISASG